NAPADWQGFIAAFNKAARGGPLAASAIKPIADSYLSAVNGTARDFDQGLSARATEAAGISSEIAKNPQRVASGAKGASGSKATIGSRAEIRIQDFRGRLGAFINQLAAQPNATLTLNDVRTQLAPPFVTADDKPLGIDQLKETP